MTKRNITALILGALLIIGVGAIVYRGRPIIKMQSENTSSSSSTPVTAGEYTMADVTSHSTPASCWSAINGSVYDLTTWINQHPGGPSAIKSLCGTDGTQKFTRKHGNFQPAQAALVLLKIGALK